MYFQLLVVTYSWDSAQYTVTLSWNVTQADLQWQQLGSSAIFSVFSARTVSQRLGGGLGPADGKPSLDVTRRVGSPGWHPPEGSPLAALGVCDRLPGFPTCAARPRRWAAVSQFPLGSIFFFLDYEKHAFCT